MAQIDLEELRRSVLNAPGGVNIPPAPIIGADDASGLPPPTAPAPEPFVTGNEAAPASGNPLDEVTPSTTTPAAAMPDPRDAEEARQGSINESAVDRSRGIEGRLRGIAERARAAQAAPQGSVAPGRAAPDPTGLQGYSGGSYAPLDLGRVTSPETESKDWDSLLREAQAADARSGKIRSTIGTILSFLNPRAGGAIASILNDNAPDRVGSLLEERQLTAQEKAKALEGTLAQAQEARLGRRADTENQLQGLEIAAGERSMEVLTPETAASYEARAGVAPGTFVGRTRGEIDALDRAGRLQPAEPDGPTPEQIAAHEAQFNTPEQVRARGGRIEMDGAPFTRMTRLGGGGGGAGGGGGRATGSAPGEPVTINVGGREIPVPADNIRSEAGIAMTADIIARRQGFEPGTPAYDVAVQDNVGLLYALRDEKEAYSPAKAASSVLSGEVQQGTASQRDVRRFEIKAQEDYDRATMYSNRTLRLAERFAQADDAAMGAVAAVLRNSMSADADTGLLSIVNEGAALAQFEGQPQVQELVSEFFSVFNPILRERSGAAVTASEALRALMEAGAQSSVGAKGRMLRALGRFQSDINVQRRAWRTRMTGASGAGRIAPAGRE